MRLIITGGTGLIGSALANSLAKDGHEVIVLSRNPARYSFPAGVRGEKWDGKTADNWGHLANGADAIVNLAGEPIAGSGLLPSRWTKERKQRIRQSRLDAGTAVCQAIAAAATKPKVLIQSSGVDYYGNVPNDQVIGEDAPNGSGFLADLTVDWEDSTAAAEEMGVRRVIIRSGIVLSMVSGALPITVLPFKFFAGGPLGNGQQWWPWIHLEDEVRAIRFLLEQETAVGPYNLCAPNPLQNKEFAKAIGRVMNRPAFMPAPAFALKLALGEIAAIVLDGRRAVPQKLQNEGFTFNYPQANDALAELLNKQTLDR
ncbi:hypothetical protein MNBD_CHLOROFLEXI01-5252 [hydrothermal vent metagenome]|uniref:Cell division inhibitor n=1 Tax=hydrothermal vent metagenome TaxID=652676 RepID=A0A3B0UPE8_9ZZZZ